MTFEDVMDNDADFEVWVNDQIEAQTSGPRDLALAEARHYAMQYASDGRVEIYEVKRTRIYEALAQSAARDSGGDR